MAASERLLRFDVSIDADPTVQEGWLDVTHLLTFVNAVRHALERSSPARLELLFHAARFINNARPLDGPAALEVASPPDGSHDGTPIAIREAIFRQQSSLAVAMTQRYLSRHTDPNELEHACQDLILDDWAVRPIVVAHLIKTCRAAFAEFRALPAGPRRMWPILAFVRFAASPIRERSIARLAHEAIRFVDEGSVPRTLT